MNRKIKAITAVFLTVAMLVTGTATAFAAEKTAADNSAIIAVANVLNGALNGVFKLISGIFSGRDIPSVEEYYAGESSNFYQGTAEFIDQAQADAYWSLGFGEESIVPKALKDGTKKYYTGGYFTQKVSSVYDDQGVNAIALNDGSGRGTTVFASVDGIGINNKDIRTIRARAIKLLNEKGITPDINAININSTHCHTVLDTQGFGLPLVPKMFFNMLPFVSPARSIDSDVYDCMVEGAAKAIAAAYTAMQPGKLYYFETATMAKNEEKGVYMQDDYAYLTNKRYDTEGFQNFIACFKFVPLEESARPTVFANLGAHPTTIDRATDKLSADYPAYIEEKLNGAGMNFMFIQGAQSPISLKKSAVETPEIIAEIDAQIAADATVADYRAAKSIGYEFARLIIEAQNNAVEVEPILNVKMQECTVKLDTGLLQLGATAQLLGTTTVKDSSAKSGYSIITEVGYIELGKSIVMLTVPGELTPQLVFGNVVTAEDAYLGTDWSCDCPAQLIGNEKRVLVMGLCNDAIGYIMPDNDFAPFIADSLWDSDLGEKLYGPYHRHYEEMLSTGSSAASTIISAINGIIEDVG